MKYKAIPIGKVAIPDVRITAVYSEETARLLHETLAAQGQRVPIVVVETDGGYELVDGLHRLEEARARGDHLIDAVISQGDATDALLQNLVLNQVRGKIHPGDMLRVIKVLTEEKGLDSEAIAIRSGFPRDYVERYWKISETAPAVQALLEHGMIGIGQALEIARLPVQAQQEEFVGVYPVGRWSIKDTREAVDQILALMPQAGQPTPPKVAPPPPVTLCSTCERETDPKMLNMVQLCPDCQGAAWRRGQEIKTTQTRDEEVADEAPTP